MNIEKKIDILFKEIAKQRALIFNMQRDLNYINTKIALLEMLMEKENEKAKYN